MSTISTQLRNFKELDKEQQNLLFFSIPNDPDVENELKEGHERMEINAVLSLGVHGEEDSYVRISPACTMIVTLIGKNKSSTSCTPLAVCDDVGRKVTFTSTISCILELGPQVRAVYDPAMHHQTGRETERTRGYIRPQSLTMALHEDCTSFSF